MALRVMRQRMQLHRSSALSMPRSRAEIAGAVVEVVCRHDSVGTSHGACLPRGLAVKWEKKANRWLQLAK